MHVAIYCNDWDNKVYLWGNGYGATLLNSGYISDAKELRCTVASVYSKTEIRCVYGFNTAWPEQNKLANGIYDMAVEKPGTTIFCGDSYSWFGSAVSKGYLWHYAGPTGDVSPWAYYTNVWHDQKIVNVTCLDGHAQSVTPSKLAEMNAIINGKDVWWQAMILSPGIMNGAKYSKQ